MQQSPLLLCDTCPRSFHQACLGLGTSQLPAGDWCCPKCVDSTQAAMRRLVDGESRRQAASERAAARTGGKAAKRSGSKGGRRKVRRTAVWWWHVSACFPIARAMPPASSLHAASVDDSNRPPPGPVCSPMTGMCWRRRKRMQTGWRSGGCRHTPLHTTQVRGGAGHPSCWQPPRPCCAHHAPLACSLSGCVSCRKRWGAASRAASRVQRLPRLPLQPSRMRSGWALLRWRLPWASCRWCCRARCRSIRS